MKPWLLLIPIILPVICGFMLLIPETLQKPKLRRWFIGAVLVIDTVLTVIFALLPDMTITLFSINDKLSVALRLDNLSRVFSVLSSVVMLAAGIYSFAYMKQERDERRFFLFYLLVAGMLSAIAYSGNMMTLYMFFEVMTLLSVPLVLHTLTKESIGAAFKYLYYSLGGASLALIGFFFVYTYGTTLEFTPGGVLDLSKLAGNETPMLLATLAAIIGFGAKAGMVPLHAWLPTAHPAAPAPASAILSGVITKAGVFATLRFVFQLVGADFIRGTFVQYTWLALAVITILYGSTAALREQRLKTRLAYSTVSQLSYLQLGLATLTTSGALGAVLHMVFHSVAKSALFMIAGVIIQKTGKTRADELHGAGGRLPLAMWCFALLGVALVGIPPAGGFFSKWAIAGGSLTSDAGFFTWLGPVALLIGALLTAWYLFPISVRSLFAGDTEKQPKIKVAGLMLLPIILLTAAAFLTGLFSGSLSELLSRLGLII